MCPAPSAATAASSGTATTSSSWSGAGIGVGERGSVAVLKCDRATVGSMLLPVSLKAEHARILVGVVLEAGGVKDGEGGATRVGCASRWSGIPPICVAKASCARTFGHHGSIMEASDGLELARECLREANRVNGCQINAPTTREIVLVEGSESDVVRAVEERGDQAFINGEGVEGHTAVLPDASGEVEEATKEV